MFNRIVEATLTVYPVKHDGKTETTYSGVIRLRRKDLFKYVGQQVRVIVEVI